MPVSYGPLTPCWPVLLPFRFQSPPPTRLPCTFTGSRGPYARDSCGPGSSFSAAWRSLPRGSLACVAAPFGCVSLRFVVVVIPSAWFSSLLRLCLRQRYLVAVVTVLCTLPFIYLSYPVPPLARSLMATLLRFCLTSSLRYALLHCRMLVGPFWFSLPDRRTSLAGLRPISTCDCCPFTCVSLLLNTHTCGIYPSCDRKGRFKSCLGSVAFLRFYADSI